MVIVDHLIAKTLESKEPLFRFLAHPPRFLARQIREMREGGLPVVLLRVTTIFMMAPAVVVLLMAAMVRPLVMIRFGQVRTTTLGPLAGETELYLCHRDAGIPDRRTFDILFFGGSACNQQLKRMWNRTLLVSPLAELPHMLARKLPGLGAQVVPMESHGDRDVLGLLARTPPHLSFTAEEERWGQSALRELGVTEGSPFICFLARDGAYVDFRFPGHGSDQTNSRNSCIHSYVPAAEGLARRGYFALRMGAVVKEALDTTNPMIVDYANKHRTDFLDIYLGAKCRFFIGDPNGYMAVPVLFRRPLAIVNCIHLELVWSWSPNYLLIPKKLWLRKERRFMTFRECLDIQSMIFREGLDIRPVGRALSSAEYDQLGIEVVDNTPEEIAAVAVEMDERLNGTWRTTEEDEELQRRFWSLFKHSNLNGVLLSRIGSEFLRQNRDLLE